MKLPAEVSSLPPDEMLSTVGAVVKAYGESIRQLTKAAAENGAAITEDLSKHVKAYSALVATKARLEQTLMKSRPVGPTGDPSFEERANRVWEQLTDNGRDSHAMAIAATKFLVLCPSNSFQILGLAITRVCVIARSEATKQSPARGMRPPGRGLAEEGRARHLTMSLSIH
jgi:hypothetical protein